MKRLNLKNDQIRPDNQKINETIGFDYHMTADRSYWEEKGYFSFSMKEIAKIEKASNEIHQMCFKAIDHIVENDLMGKLGIDPKLHKLIKQSWEREDWSMFGRFDFYFDRSSKLKMYEYNADTPTSLLEASLAQYNWKEQIDEVKDLDQFNSIHEKLIDWWKAFKEEKNSPVVYFTTIKENLEDYRNTEYIMDCAIQAGVDAKFIFLEDLGTDGEYFYDMKDNKIDVLFKLYPWEWIMEESFGPQMTNILEKNNCVVIEPIWKMLLSNKAILAILFELFPDCPYLLPTYFSSEKLESFVKKPFLSREGQNIEIHKSGQEVISKEGHYESDNNIYQEVCELPDFNGRHPVIGSWIIGEESAGMGIREDENLITANLSHFISHVISKENL